METQEGISFTEFSYQLLQAHDFYHLKKELGVNIQVGGSDQWGNITAGIDYCKRRGVKDKLVGVTVPLVFAKNGQKLGKSANNAVWLSDAKTSDFDMYQYFIQTATDELVGSWLRLMTLMPIEEIEEVCRSSVGGHAQRVLAYKVVELVRGREAADRAKEKSESLFQSSNGAGSQDLTSDASISRADVDSKTVFEIVSDLKLLKSKSETRRMIEQGGLYVDEQRVESVESQIKIEAQSFVIRIGKKKRFLIEIE